jgi:hypothetical protein
MSVVERHTTPDGQLTLIVDLTDGDFSIGFDGYSWHTHGDILQAWGCAGTPEDAVRIFVDDVISSRRPICVYRTNGSITDIAVPSDYDDSLDEQFKSYAEPGETMELRHWNAAGGMASPAWT